MEQVVLLGAIIILGIDGYYVDGVSLTHGGAGSRQHIWTFATGLTEVDTSYLTTKCPCDTILSLHLLGMISFVKVA